MTNTPPWLLAFLFTLMVIMSVLAVTYILNHPATKRIPPEMPVKIRLIWPLVLPGSILITPLLTIAMQNRLQSMLVRSGKSDFLSPGDVCGMQLSLAIIFSLIWLMATYQLDNTLAGYFAAVLVAVFIPINWLRSEIQLAKSQITRDLPAFLEYLCISLTAGQNFSGALNLAIRNGPAGMLKQELRHVANEVRAGKSRAEALRNSSDRVNLNEYTSLVRSIIQAESTGASLATTLGDQAEQRRNERFLRAEKKAMEAPVKLLLPLVTFIFPVSFLILVFPIGVKIFYGF